MRFVEVLAGWLCSWGENVFLAKIMRRGYLESIVEAFIAEASTTQRIRGQEGGALYDRQVVDAVRYWPCDRDIEMVLNDEVERTIGCGIECCCKSYSQEVKTERVRNREEQFVRI